MKTTEASLTRKLQRGTAYERNNAPQPKLSQLPSLRPGTGQNIALDALNTAGSVISSALPSQVTQPFFFLFSFFSFLRLQMLINKLKTEWISMTQDKTICKYTVHLAFSKQQAYSKWSVYTKEIFLINKFNYMSNGGLPSPDPPPFAV